MDDKSFSQLPGPSAFGELFMISVVYSQLGLITKPERPVALFLAMDKELPFHENQHKRIRFVMKEWLKLTESMAHPSILALRCVWCNGEITEIYQRAYDTQDGMCMQPC